MSGAVFYRQLQTDTRPVAPLDFSKALDGDDGTLSAEEDTTGETNTRAQEQDLEQPAALSVSSSPSLPTQTAKISRHAAAITPPRTPTRSRARQHRETDSAENTAPAAEAKDTRQNTVGLLTPKTPTKSLAGGAALSTSGASGSGQLLKERSKQSTGLTPAMNKMFRLTDGKSLQARWPCITE